MDRLDAALYLLMRDHVPTGVVAEVIEKTRESEVFLATSPELAALAKRYGAELRGTDTGLAGAEVEPVEADLEPPAPTAAELRERRERSRPKTEREAMRPQDRKRVSEATKEQVRQYVRDNGGKVTPGELDGAIGFSTSTRSRILRELRSEGFCDAIYEGKQRYIVLASDSPEGAGQSSPTGTANSPPPALGKGVGGDGSQHGGALPPTCSQDDGDGISSNLEETQNADAGRDRRPPSPAPRPAPRPRAPKVEEAPEPEPVGGGVNNWRKPQREAEETEVDGATMSRARMWMLGQRNFRRRQFAEAFPDLTPGQLGRVLSAAIKDGGLAMHHETGGAFYTPKGSNGGADSGPPRMGDGGTLEGRIMEVLGASPDGLTQEQLASRTGAGKGIVVAVGKLYRESMIRATTLKGERRYVAV